MNIYEISAGGNHKTNLGIILTHKEKLNLRLLKQEYEKLNTPIDNKEFYSYTKNFIKWLIEEKEFIQPEVSSIFIKILD